MLSVSSRAAHFGALAMGETLAQAPPPTSRCGTIDDRPGYDDP
jgi:hypothetical protein